jgi:hypothetical protein
MPVAAAAAQVSGLAQRAAGRKTVAAIVTEYRWYSHADVVCGRLLGGYSANNIWTAPRTRLVSLYRAQTPQTDMSRDMAARHGFRIYPTIREALTLGGNKLAVDAVVFIGEHGSYPFNELGQHLYPRFELFSEILDVYEASGRAVPTLFDKHFSYDWSKAKALFERSRKLRFPLMAGSSIPVTLRSPDVQPALGTPMKEAACVGHGPLDAYGFHLLETCQCMVERRRGGETGVREVEWIEGERIWKWLDDGGAWARGLLTAAYAHQKNPPPTSLEAAAKNPVLFRIDYRDGFRAVALMLSPSGNDRTVAIRITSSSEPLVTLFGPPTERPLPHFDGFVRCAEEMFVTGKELWPAERTLLTTGMLTFLFQSKAARSALSTPELGVTYRAPADVFYQKA